MSHERQKEVTTECQLCCRYNASSYENDIALVQLEKLPFSDKCLEDNPAVRAVCVPWSTELFRTNHTCSISGWGRTAGMFIQHKVGGSLVGSLHLLRVWLANDI